MNRYNFPFIVLAAILGLCGCPRAVSTCHGYIRKRQLDLQMKLEFRGITRIVLLVGRYAIKFPNFRYSWHHFLQGLLANINEKQTWRYNSGTLETGLSHLLCPVVWASWGGWILVMKRAVPCTFLGMVGNEIDYSKWIVAGFGGDDKPDNYGLLDGKTVKLDYA